MQFWGLTLSVILVSTPKASLSQRFSISSTTQELRTHNPFYHNLVAVPLPNFVIWLCMLYSHISHRWRVIFLYCLVWNRKKYNFVNHGTESRVWESLCNVISLIIIPFICAENKTFVERNKVQPMKTVLFYQNKRTLVTNFDIHVSLKS